MKEAMMAVVFKVAREWRRKDDQIGGGSVTEKGWMKNRIPRRGRGMFVLLRKVQKARSCGRARKSEACVDEMGIWQVAR